MHEPSTWTTTLTCLQNQKGYLDGLLSKTATTLNALRDKQSRNDRVLSTNPGPRPKKKKMLQNRWRTDKTIKTCENEEKVILDCLRVCEDNIRTLESILNPQGTFATVAEYNLSNSKCSYRESAITDFDWNGWADEGPASPFHRERHHALILDEIPPEAYLDDASCDRPDTATTAPASNRPPPFPPRVGAPPSSMLPPVPPNTTHRQFHHSVLSPEAACFEPSITHFTYAEEGAKNLDKLSISGLLASKRMSQILGRRFSDAAVGHVSRRFSHARPELANAREQHRSWGPDSRQYRAYQNTPLQAPAAKRSYSL
ncbi:hypothetical protein K505DRAFT_230137 [Melanomma pulvis-pyrius CBS 109.77]|uniref:Uncharacterized protein n=1 Tax=Melanomma pulvis-pyrius CBS 109.77 TaxID=1314802 RepID=A0A6A6XV07_9PLEO|nr:hypothetical protein K505DRAFT_230137 [Melanomma pulvis-pyrius CBS 109.77]